MELDLDQRTLLADKICYSKKKFRTEIYVSRKVDSFEKLFNKPMRYYFCPICQNYHITTKPNLRKIKHQIEVWGNIKEEL